MSETNNEYRNVYTDGGGVERFILNDSDYHPLTLYKALHHAEYGNERAEVRQIIKTDWKSVGEATADNSQIIEELREIAGWELDPEQYKGTRVIQTIETARRILAKLTREI